MTSGHPGHIARKARLGLLKDNFHHIWLCLPPDGHRAECRAVAGDCVGPGDPGGMAKGWEKRVRWSGTAGSGADTVQHRTVSARHGCLCSCSLRHCVPTNCHARQHGCLHSCVSLDKSLALSGLVILIHEVGTVLPLIRTAKEGTKG